MATRESIELALIGDITSYQKAAGKIPGVTDKEAEKAAKAFVKRMRRGQINAALEAKKAAKSAGQSWTEAGKEAAKGFGIAFAAVGAAIGTGVVLANELAAVRREITSLSQATSINIDTLAGLRFAAGRAGEEFSEVAGGLEDFGEKMFDAANGGGAAEEAFQLLGFSAEDLQGRMDDVDGVLREVIQGMQETEDGALKNTIQQQLWGDAGNALAVSLGNIPLEEFVQGAKDFGVDFGPEAVAQSEAWTRAMNELSSSTQGAAADLFDFFEIGTRAEGFSLGIFTLATFFKEAAKEIIRNATEIIRVTAAIATGQFALAKSIIETQQALNNESSAMDRILLSTVLASKAFFDLRTSEDEIAEGAKKGADELGKLKDEEEKAAKAADELRKAFAKLTEEEKTAREALIDIIGTLTEDQLTAEEEVAAARLKAIQQIEEQEAALRKLGRAGIDVALELKIAELARIEAADRAERDLAGLRKTNAKESADLEFEANEIGLAGIAKIDEAQAEAAELEKERKAEALEFAQEIAGQILDLAVQGFQFGQEILANEIAEDKAARDKLRDSRLDIIEQIKNTEDEAGKAALRVELDNINAGIQARRAEIRQRKKAAKALFIGEKAAAISGVVFNTAQAILKAFALFGPPPSPPGIASAALAGAAGAIQVGQIVSQKPPQFHTGFTAGFSAGPDERAAILTAGESVLASRATENLGRANVDSLNRTGEMPGGGGGLGLFFEGRQIDELVTRTINRGGTTRRMIRRITSTGRPRGQAVAFGSR